jgi:hypothetical protein
LDAADAEAVGSVASGEHRAARPSPSAPPTTSASSDSESSDEEDESMFYIGLLRGHKMLIMCELINPTPIHLKDKSLAKTDKALVVIIFFVTFLYMQ